MAVFSRSGADLPHLGLDPLGFFFLMIEIIVNGHGNSLLPRSSAGEMHRRAPVCNPELIRPLPLLSTRNCVIRKT